MGLAFATVVIVLGGLVVADQNMHRQHDRFETMNYEGYRGNVVQAKRPGEIRVALVGESSAFGYELNLEYTLAAKLEPRLSQALGGRPVSVVNLAANGDSIPCYGPTLKHYAWMQPDIVLIDAGYNDHVGTVGRPVSTCAREQNRVFQLTGYWPVIDLYLREKFYQLRYGSVEEGYRQAARAVDPLQAAQGASTTLSSNQTPEQATAYFVDNLTRLIDDQLAQGRAVVYMTQPYLTDYHRQQQVAVRQALKRYAGTPRFQYVDLGDALNLGDRALSSDGMHPTDKGNDVLSADLAPPLAGLVQRLGW